MEDIIEKNNKDEIVNKINLVNSNDEPNNFENLNNEDNDLDVYEQEILDQKFGLCPECNQPHMKIGAKNVIPKFW